MINRFARFSLAIAQIDRCWHALAAKEMASYGLNSPHAVYLNVLHKYPQGITAAQLSQLCGKHKADVSRMVAILETRGLVRREGAGKSLYRAKLLLTEDGIRAAEHVRDRAAIAVELAGSGLSDETRETFYAALEQIAENLQTLCKEGLPSMPAKESE